MMNNESVKRLICIASVVCFSAGAFLSDYLAADETLPNDDIVAQNILETETQTDTDNQAIVEATGITRVSSAGFSTLISEITDNEEKLSTVKGETKLPAAGFSAIYDEFINLDESEELAATYDKLNKLMGIEDTEAPVITGYTNLGVINIDSYLNVRSGPSTNHKIIGTMPPNSACDIISEESGWYKIKSGSVEGYVYSDYVLTGSQANYRATKYMEEVAVVTTDILNVREEPNTNCTVSTGVMQGEQLEILEVLDGWLKVNINNLIGYVSSDYVEIRNVLPTAVEVKEIEMIDYSSFASGDQTVSGNVNDLLSYALSFLGYPYRAGGLSLTNGTDCCGFTMLIFAHFGYSLSRTCEGQYYQGVDIPLSEVKPGDILFYSYGGSLGHVAIYIGNGQIVHASTPSGGIRISNANFTAPCAARRIMQ